MTHILTLVSAPDKGLVDSACIDRVQGVLSAHQAQAGERDWLNPNVACEMAFSGADSDALREALSEALMDVDVDVLVTPIEGRRKKILVADMDSTTVQGETLDDLAEYAGIKDEIAAITEKTMNGELDFQESLKERVGLMKGLSADFMEEAFEQVVLTPGARELVGTMKANGAWCALVSGGFTFFTSRVAAMVGFDVNQGNRFVIREGVLTGEVEFPIVTRETKLEVLQAAAHERGLDLSETVTVGDGANDLPMLQAAGLGVAFHAKPVVNAIARHRVEHGDLSALLYAQGYRASEFVTI